MKMNIIDIEINTKEIKLDQFIKWASIVASGGEAKELISSGAVTVNNLVETRRGRKLKNDDIVGIDEKHFYRVFSLV
jgi:ribosome-associated protein